MIDVSWLMQTLSDVPGDDAWLTDAEVRALERFRFPKRRTDWRLGRWTAKHALARSLGAADGAAFEIRAAADGAPEAFHAGEPLPRVISISHTGGRAACAVAPAGTAVGCDLERVEARGGVLATDFFTVAEQELVRRFSGADDRDLVETVVWSAKESALKALREGLRLDTRAVEVRLLDACTTDGWHPLAAEYLDGAARFDGWWRRAGDLVFTFVAAPEPSPPSHDTPLSRSSR